MSNFLKACLGHGLRRLHGHLDNQNDFAGQGSRTPSGSTTTSPLNATPVLVPAPATWRGFDQSIVYVREVVNRPRGVR
jgi:hypothetical protein